MFAIQRLNQIPKIMEGDVKVELNLGGKCFHWSGAVGVKGDECGHPSSFAGCFRTLIQEFIGWKQAVEVSAVVWCQSARKQTR